MCFSLCQHTCHFARNPSAQSMRKKRTGQRQPLSHAACIHATKLPCHAVACDHAAEQTGPIASYAKRNAKRKQFSCIAFSSSCKIWDMYPSFMTRHIFLPSSSTDLGANLNAARVAGIDHAWKCQSARAHPALQSIHWY